METARRRAFLEAMAEKAETDGARLKALDLLERLDAREEASRRPEPPDFQYDDEWLARTAALFLGLGFAAPLIEEQAREIRGRGDTRALRPSWTLTHRGAASGGVRLHADLIMLARLASALTRARAVPLAA